MIITQKGVVDITPEYNRALRPVFCVSEGDKTSRQIVLTVMRGGEAFLIPSGATVYIIGKKSDSNIFTYRCNYSGPDVTFDITEQMSAASGIVLCELQINLSGEVLGSANFVYWTEPAPIENGTYSESDLNIMLEAIAGAERLDNFYAGIEDMVADAVEQIQIMPGQVVIDPTLLVNGAAADAAATGNAVRSFLNALITETTAEATIATCDDAAGGLPLKTLTANIVPAQAGSGDPSPENVRPISGYTGVTVSRAGKNLLNGDNIGLERDGERTHAWNIGTGIPAGTHTFSCDVSGASNTRNVGVDFYTVRGGERLGTVNIPSGTHGHFAALITLNKRVTYIHVYISSADASGAKITISNPMVEIGNVASEFEPYNGATYPVTFPSEAGTVYGGTLTVNSDGSGTLTVTKKAQNLGSLTWGYGAPRFYSSAIANSITPTDTGDLGAICDSYKLYETGALANMPDFSFFVNSAKMSSTTKRVVVTDSRYTDAAAFKTAVDGVYVVYTLATPITYALSAVEVAQMLSGVNNVWTDAAGTLNVEYYANTALYVEKIVNAQKRMITGVEESMTATKNYAIGDLLIVGTTLYRTTAAIASGAAITVGTNVTETTVAEQLLALA